MKGRRRAMAEKLLEAKNLCKYFPAGKKQTLKAVDDVSLYINKGETLGLVGESGCGKTTCGRTLTKLYSATSGTVTFDGKDVSSLKGAELLKFKKDVQMIFQDPYSSLDPRMTIAEIIGEGMDVHFKLSAAEKAKRVNTVLLMSFRADSVSVSALRVHWRSSPSSLSATSPSRRSTCPFRHRLSICSSAFRKTPD